jgi:hypothetical protein
MTRKVDKVATEIARARQEAGMERLSQLFGITPLKLYLSGLDKHTGRLTRFRRRANVPPMQDAEHRRKRKLRKIAHESRRRNR